MKDLTTLNNKDAIYLTVEDMETSAKPFSKLLNAATKDSKGVGLYLTLNGDEPAEPMLAAIKDRIKPSEDMIVTNGMYSLFLKYATPEWGATISFLSLELMQQYLALDNPAPIDEIIFVRWYLGGVTMYRLISEIKEFLNACDEGFYIKTTMGGKTRIVSKGGRIIFSEERYKPLETSKILEL